MKNEVLGFTFSKAELPRIIESGSREWVSYGRDNLYPNELMEAYDGSAIHAAIVQAKSLMVAGGGIGLDGLDADGTRDLLDRMEASNALRIRKMLDLPNAEESLHDIVAKVSLDWQIFGAMSLEVTWSRDRKEIARIKHIPVMRVRSGKMVNGEVDEYFYSRDWAKITRSGYTPVRLPAFSLTNREEPVQLVYVRNERPDLDYYGCPSYHSTLSYIRVDSQMGSFYSSLIKNGFNPSFVAKFYGSYTPEEKEFNMVQMRKQFAGTDNSGKMIMTFSEDKESAPDFEPVQATNLDKQYLALTETVVQQVISGHRVTSPMLLGIALPGKLGYSNELENAYKIFQSTVIAPDQKVIEKLITRLFAANGIYRKVSLLKFNPIA